MDLIRRSYYDTREDFTKLDNRDIFIILYLAGETDPILLSTAFYLHREFPEDKDIRDLLLGFKDDKPTREVKILKLLDIILDHDHNGEPIFLNQVEKYFGSNSYLDSEVKRRLS